MRDRDGSPGVSLHPHPDEIHRMGERLRLGAQIGAGPVLSHDGRLEVRDAVEVHRTIGVGQRHGRADRERIGQHVDAVTEQPRLEPETCGGVVVATRDDHAGARLMQRDEHVAEKRVRGAGRCRRIEDVSGDDDDVDRVLPNLHRERSENLGQRVHGRVAMEGAADVPVGGVQDSHTHTLRTPTDIQPQACRGIRSWARNSWDSGRNGCRERLSARRRRAPAATASARPSCRAP